VIAPGPPSEYSFDTDIKVLLVSVISVTTLDGHWADRQDCKLRLLFDLKTGQWVLNPIKSAALG
jgi:hypothetical protein